MEEMEEDKRRCDKEEERKDKGINKSEKGLGDGGVKRRQEISGRGREDNEGRKKVRKGK